MASLVRRLAADVDEYAGPGATRIGAAVLDLTAAALSAWTGRPESPREEVLLRRIDAFIERRLDDPALTRVWSPPHTTCRCGTRTGSSTGGT